MRVHMLARLCVLWQCCKAVALLCVGVTLRARRPLRSYVDQTLGYLAQGWLQVGSSGGAPWETCPPFLCAPSAPVRSPRWQVLGRALKSLPRSEIVVSTKVGRWQGCNPV